MNPKPSKLAERLRTICVLGRVSNLPTIGSNCLAGWLLGGGSDLSKLAWLCAGAALLYTGGMFLNDAADADWDLQHRPERPIPAGRISRNGVYVAASGLLVAGWSLLLLAGGRTALTGLVLIAIVGIYDFVHKQVAFAPALMASCRGLLYLTAAATGKNLLTMPVLLGSLAITGYVAGLSSLARHESTGNWTSRWPLLLLLSPVALAFIGYSAATGTGSRIVAGVVLVIWTGWCLRFATAMQRPNPGRCVGGLLAGIPLVDGLAATDESWLVFAIFGGLFLLARGWQRLTPAT